MRRGRGRSPAGTRCPGSRSRRRRAAGGAGEGAEGDDRQRGRRARLRFQWWVRVRARRARAADMAATASARRCNVAVQICNRLQHWCTHRRACRACASARSSGPASAIVRVALRAVRASAASTRRRSPTSPRRPTSRRARSSATSRRRRPWSSTTTTSSMACFAARCATAAGRRGHVRRAARLGARARRRGVDFEQPDERARRRLIRETPALAARERANLARFERLLAEAVAEDLGVDRRRRCARTSSAPRRSPRSTRSRACATTTDDPAPTARPTTSSTRRWCSSRAGSTRCAAPRRST